MRVKCSSAVDGSLRKRSAIQPDMKWYSARYRDWPEAQLRARSDRRLLRRRDRLAFVPARDARVTARRDLSRANLTLDARAILGADRFSSAVAAHGSGVVRLLPQAHLSAPAQQRILGQSGFARMKVGSARIEPRFLRDATAPIQRALRSWIAERCRKHGRFARSMQAHESMLLHRGETGRSEAAGRSNGEEALVTFERATWCRFLRRSRAYLFECFEPCL